MMSHRGPEHDYHAVRTLGEFPAVRVQRRIKWQGKKQESQDHATTPTISASNGLLQADQSCIHIPGHVLVLPVQMLSVRCREHSTCILFGLLHSPVLATQFVDDPFGLLRGKAMPGLVIEAGANGPPTVSFPLGRDPME